MSDNEHEFNQMDDIVNVLANGSQQLKNMFAQLKTEYDSIRDNAISEVRFQAEMEKREALIQQRSDIINILHRILGTDHILLFQQILAQLQVESNSAKTCANCGRDAFLECTACRRSCYCSAYCQQCDWPVHQHQCEIISVQESNLATDALTNQVHESNSSSRPDSRLTSKQ